MREVTKIANCDEQADVDRRISMALDVLVAALGLSAGSVKIYVNQGKWSPRIEVQQHITHEVKKR